MMYTLITLIYQSNSDVSIKNSEIWGGMRVLALMHVQNPIVVMCNMQPSKVLNNIFEFFMY